MTTQIKKIISILISFLAGAVFMALLVFAYLFNFSKVQYHSFIDTKRELHSYMNKFDTQELRMTKASYKNYIGFSNNLLQNTSSELLPQPIPDDLFEAYSNNLSSLILQKYPNRASNARTSNGQADKVKASHWIYLPLNDILAYAIYLKLKKFHSAIGGTNKYEKASGITVQMGLIDTTNISIEYKKGYYDYFKQKQGAVIPMFIATTIRKDINGENYLSFMPSVLATDCNCGNPPCNIDLDPKKECAKSENYCVGRCPKPKEQ